MAVKLVHEAVPANADTQGDMAARLKVALRGMPGPVALITTCDPVSAEPAGLAASSVIAVSMAPPSMLVCVNRTASAHTVIEAAGRVCINLVRTTLLFGTHEAFVGEVFDLEESGAAMPLGWVAGGLAQFTPMHIDKNGILA